MYLFIFIYVFIYFIFIYVFIYIFIFLESKVAELLLCKHTFHMDCLAEMLGVSSYLQCPACKTFHGVKIGNQPHGIMEISEIPETLPGFSDCDTILITY